MEKRFSNGLSFLGAYTWGKSIDEQSQASLGFDNSVGTQNEYNYRAEKARSDYDIAHRVVVSYSYDLPFGRSANGVAKLLLQGWQLVGIDSFNTGNPYTIHASQDFSNAGAATANTANVLRAAQIAGMDRDNHHLWLKKDPEYAAAFDIAWKRGTDALEAEAVRRAYEGVTKPIFHGGKRAIDVVQNPDGSIKRDESGKPIGIPAAVRDYSDTLLIFLLKGRNPAIFGDRLKQEHSGPNNSAIIVNVRSLGTPQNQK